MSEPDLRNMLARADHCHGLVVRDGIEDACGRPPVAIIDGRGTEDEGYWPACAYHANRYGRGHCVPLADLLDAWAPRWLLAGLVGGPTQEVTP